MLSRIQDKIWSGIMGYSLSIGFKSSPDVGWKADHTLCDIWYS